MEKNSNLFLRPIRHSSQIERNLSGTKTEQQKKHILTSGNIKAKKMGDEMRFNFESSAKRGFGGDFNEETHNREKPISQKSTHLILYGGLSLVAIWIILFEIIQP